MNYKIKDIKANRELGFNTINAMEELVFASYVSERVHKIFNNEDDQFRIETTGSYYMNKVSDIALDELPVILRVLEKMRYEIISEDGALNDSYIINSEQKDFKVNGLNYQYMYLLPSFNEDQDLIMYVSNDEETYNKQKDYFENAKDIYAKEVD